MQERDNNPSSSHLLDVHAKSAIRGAAKAAGLTALLSVSGTIISLIAYITKSSLAKAGPAKEGFDDTAMPVATQNAAFVLSAFTIITLIFVFLIYSFSRLTQQGLKSGNNHMVNKGLSYLSLYFKIIGIGLLGLLVFSFLRMFATGL